MRHYSDNPEIEDGMGFSGLAPSPAERREDRAIAQAVARERGLREKLDQIATVCRDNAPPSCDKGMALDFVRQIAESK